MAGSKDEEVSGYDDFGTAGNSRHEHEQANNESGDGLPGAIRRTRGEADAHSRHPGPQGQAARDDAIIGAARILDTATDEELERAGLYRDNNQIVSYSGQLPPPGIFYSFSPEHQERMCRWVDSFTVEESRRQNRAVDAAIRNANRAQIYNFVFNAVVVVLTFVAFLVTGEAAAFLGFALPGVSIAANVAIDAKEKKGAENNAENRNE
ncbi:MAG: hypothetical protein IJ111_13495 [Eggerthellaceae bacterium]|nr:hypothetical protein [Eggerthellaceae bacterium]